MGTFFNPKKRNNFFDKILMETPDTNTFDLSFSNKLSMNMGELVPIMTQEVYPGDKFAIKAEHMIKMAPLATPVMHRCKVDLHAFFVPNRLLWDNFEEFQAYDSLNTIPQHPFIDAGNTNINPNKDVPSCSLADYLGVPVTAVDLATYDSVHPYRNLNPFPFMAYMKIWDDYYRDQNLQTEKFKKCVDGNNNVNLQGLKTEFFGKAGLLKRAWEKDYFTSCLPFAQKGQEVVLPLGTTADIKYDGALGRTKIKDLAGNEVDPAGVPDGELRLSVQPDRLFVNDLVNDPQVNIDVSENHYVDLGNATSASVNALRYAVRLQEFFERNARLGTRYIEQMLGKFGVRISDSRAHRSELIGSTSTLINFSEVLATADTGTMPLGQQAGHGMAINNDFLTNFYVEEHGWIMVIASVIPETAYQQGIHKKFYKKDILDYYDPMFANLGEQVVHNWEVYAENNTTFNNTFGYQSRYAELKYNSSEVHGDMRLLHSDWHMGRIFTSPPALNASFISADPTHRIYADTDNSNRKLFCYFHFGVSAQRKLPFYSTPSLSGIGR